MEQGEYDYIIGIGSRADWEAGRGSYYYIEDKNGEKALPVFTTYEALQGFVEANFGKPEAYMQMLESIGANVETHAAPLAETRYIAMPVSTDGLAEAAAMVDADYLVRDLRTGPKQEILRLPK